MKVSIKALFCFLFGCISVMGKGTRQSFNNPISKRAGALKKLREKATLFYIYTSLGFYLTKEEKKYWRKSQKLYKKLFSKIRWK